MNTRENHFLLLRWMQFVCFVVFVVCLAFFSITFPCIFCVCVCVCLDSILFHFTNVCIVPFRFTDCINTPIHYFVQRAHSAKHTASTYIYMILIFCPVCDAAGWLFLYDNGVVEQIFSKSFSKFVCLAGELLFILYCSNRRKCSFLR